MWTAEGIYGTFEARRKELGLSQAEVSFRALGKRSSSHLQSMANGKMPSFSKVEKIANVLGLDVYLGMPASRPSEEDRSEIEHEFVPVRRYDLALSAGHGTAGNEPEELTPIAFRARWLSDNGLRADACCVVSISGDSMEPTLHDGDIVLVDCRPSEIRNGRVYAFVDSSGDLKVKRLERHDRQLLLRSDNTDHQTEVRGPANTEMMKIIGPVRWSGHTW